MMMLNVLFLPSWYPTRDRPGFGIFIREHAKAASLYHNVHVLHMIQADSQLKGLWAITSDRVEEDIRTIRGAWRRLKIPKGKRVLALGTIWAAFRYVTQTGFQPDIIHAHVCRTALPALLLGKLYRIPVVITEHWSMFPLKQIPEWLLREARFSFSRADVVLSVSQFLKDSIQAYGINGRFQVVPNTVNIDIFFPPADQLQRLTYNKCPKALAVGISEPKGIPILLQAVKLVYGRGHRFRLDIIGDGPKRFEYQRMSDDLGLENAVNFHGWRSKEEVANHMRCSDFFVQASLWETFGVTFIEAMACGRPVIGTQIPALKEIVTDEVGMLVPPGDSLALADAIERMLKRYWVYSSKKTAAYAHQQFSYEAVGKQLSQIYCEVSRV